jgi:hypothetical protein
VAACSLLEIVGGPIKAGGHINFAATAKPISQSSEAFSIVE